MNDVTMQSTRHERRFRFSSGWPLLLAAFAVLAVSNGRWIFPLATWVGPILLMRYLRTTTRLWKGLAAMWTVFFLAAPVGWLGLWPFPPLVMAKIVAVGAVYSLVPYLLDRWSRDRIGGIAQTLVFPASAVALEFWGSLRSGTTWGNVAYTQTENLALLQFASVAGIWGISFLMGWLAPVVNNLWEEGWSHRVARRGALAYGAALALVLAFGSARLVFFAPGGETVRVASVTPPEAVDFESPEGRELLMEFQKIMMKTEVDEATARRVRERFETVEDPLFEATQRLARAGAQLVVWPEASLISFDDEQDAALIERGRRLAVEEGIYLGFSIAKIPLETQRMNENRLLLIAPDGEVQHTYLKHHTVPMVEEPFAVPGSEAPFTAKTPFGLVGAVICYDMDDPRYLRSAGRQNLDILLVPTGDWPAIKEIHRRMSIMRAVEQGVSLVRPANHGINLVVDFQGRVLSRLDHYATSQREMSAWVPQRGTRTLYTWWGDALAWACAALSALFAAQMLWASTVVRSLRLRPAETPA